MEVGIVIPDLLPIAPENIDIRHIETHACCIQSTEKSIKGQGRPHSNGMQLIPDRTDLPNVSIGDVIPK